MLVCDSGDRQKDDADFADITNYQGPLKDVSVCETPHTSTEDVKISAVEL